MKPIVIKTICTVLLGAALIAWGQDRTSGDGPAPDDGAERKRTFGNGVLSENVALYDVDNSGNLSVEEYQALQADRASQGRHENLRSRWDTNRDGTIDAQERAAAALNIRRLIEERRCRRFNEADANSDGALTLEEFMNISAVSASTLSTDLFRHLDHNGDRRISKEEFLRSLNSVRPTPIGPDPAPAPRDDADRLDDSLSPARP